ncbi:unnamed protein product, partial [Heterobilharzia americana]
MNASTETSPDIMSREVLMKSDIKKNISNIKCQVGKVEKTTSTQTMITEGVQKAKPQDESQQYEVPKSTFSQQADFITATPQKLVHKAISDVVCQVGQVKSDMSTQSAEFTAIKPAYRDTGTDPVQPWGKKVANDVVTQTGIVHTSKITQAELKQEQPVYVKTIETQDAPIISHRQTADAGLQVDFIRQLLRKSTTDVICQVGNITESIGMQIDDPHRVKTTLAATQSTSPIVNNKEIQADMGFKTELKLIPKAINDVVCQVGQVKSDMSTQSAEFTAIKPAYRDTGTDPVQPWGKKVANDVVTQTGIVHTSKITQAELKQEQPVYVKTIETQDAPIISHRQTADAGLQVDFIRQLLRKSTTDVICQVGNITESIGMQIDDPHRVKTTLAATQSTSPIVNNKEIQADMGFKTELKLIPKAINDVVCQVGQVKSDMSTQSAEFTAIKPAYRDTGTDPVQPWGKKVANDVVTQTGIVHTSKITQAELKQEQPVYVKTIETQDAPIISHRQTADAGLQVDFIRQLLRKSTTDVICQVGNITESIGMQIDDPHRVKTTFAATQSTSPIVNNKEIQADMGFKTELKLIPKAINDVVCQVGQVKSDMSTQSAEFTAIKPAYRDTGTDPVQPWGKKVANDVVTQTGIVHTSKITQAELKQEQPVYVTTTGTQDTPIYSQKKTEDVGQQVELVKTATTSSLCDVVCQVGSIFEDAGLQTDGLHRKESFAIGTDSVRAPMTESTHQFEHPKASFSTQTSGKRSISCFDLVTQCGVVYHTKSSQTVEPFVPVAKEVMELIQKPIAKPQLDVVIQTGVVMKTEGTMTKDILDRTPLMTSVGVDSKPKVTTKDVGSYPVPTSIDRQSRQVQVYIKPASCHKDIQAETLLKETATISDLIKVAQTRPSEVVTQTGVLKQNADTQTILKMEEKYS